MQNHKVLYSLGRLVIRAYARLLLQMDIEAPGDLPLGSKLFVANHPSATDPFLIHLVSTQHLSVLITQSAFDFPLLGWYMRSTKQIPVEAGKGETTLDAACQSIDAGRSIAIFTEGTLSPQTGGFHPPRSGAARLALRTGIPVIPVGIYLPCEHSHCIKSRLTGKPTEGYWYLRGPYAVTVGKPLHFTGDCNDKPLVKQIAETIMENIRLLALESRLRVREAS